MSGRVEYVLDSTALIALLSLEPGHQRVEDLLDKAVISAVNLAETVNKLAQRASSINVVRDFLMELELVVEDWSEDMAYLSAELAPLSKTHGLSLGDRACLTLARRLRATAVTSDRQWQRIPSLGIPVLLFR